MFTARLKIGLVTASLALMAAGAHAQTLTGTVRDDTAAVLPGAVTTLRTEEGAVAGGRRGSHARTPPPDERKPAAAPDAEVSDIDDFYTSRLAGESAGGVDDIHSHPALPRSVRVGLQFGF